jgi:hypothetical protein
VRGRDAVTGETTFVVALANCALEARAKVEGSELIIVRHSNCALPTAEYM